MGDEPRVLGGRYELGSPLGRGGMAQVRRARDTRLGRQVAVKLLRTDLAGDPTFQARFRREAQASAGLNHPNIVAVYDTGEETDSETGVSVPYIVMELVEGHTLRELLRDGRKILPDRALEFTAGVLDALAYSHRAGIVHRDIKPANVMLTNSGRVKVMDFGIARAVADTSATMTQTAAVIGTAQYLSPEQARGETVDARSDIYSAGCLLYELLVGHPPFRGDSPVSVAYQHVRENPVPPGQLDPMVSDDMDAIVLKALAKDPADRYQSASEMRDDINRLLNGQAVHAVTPTAATVPASAAAATRVLPSAPVQPATAATGTLEETGSTTPQRAVEDPSSAKRRGWVWGLVAFLVVVALGVGTYLVMNPGTRVETVAVPNVTDRSRDLAESMLTEAGLLVDVEEVAGPDDATVGKVIGQDPIAGVNVEKGSTVSIQVNVGPKKATIPTDLVGKTAKAAETALTDLGFTNIDREEDPRATSAKANSVTSVNPTGGVTVPLDTQITIFYAPGTGTVPNFYGQTKAAAQAQAERAGFTEVTFSEEETTELPAGQVFKQSPASGETAKFSATIKLVLAKAPEPDPTPTPTPTETSESPEPEPTG
ncbi:Stk1 family PASTA domain-containing Ser/Thr kinase [Micropruina sonneratiae]|uniref:Stk1 family PASTA domain-containing Ser/Thr kinase n=1 Tax=Micropruina sonneratiae TaxID=2986940 RepID=UPI002225D243|nr:Stk1 family PASTA domain-containing Ser/Thr kinase [Micropruina sp. KQZ13P-5]MCW3159028.1 Stk1 family PASTA domain-containing Ser/Thr kinase [Micropruina sp. KQZ13P-5]